MQRRSNNPKRGFIFIPMLIAVVLGLVVATGGIIYYQSQKTERSVKESINNNIPTTIDKNIGATETTPTASDDDRSLVERVFGPEEIYLKMKSELDTATSYDNYAVISYKYGDSEFKLKYESKRNEYLTKSEKDKKALFFLITSFTPNFKSITNVREEIQGDRATLYITSTATTDVGKVTMILENGGWKIIEESWPSNPAPKKDPPANTDNWRVEKNDQYGFELKLPPTGLSSGISYNRVDVYRSNLQNSLNQLNQYRPQQKPSEALLRSNQIVVSGRKIIINEIVLSGKLGSNIEYPKTETLIELNSQATVIIDIRGYQSSNESGGLKKVSDSDFELLKKFNTAIISTLRTN